MKVTVHCLCDAVYTKGEDEPFGEGYLPGRYDCDTCSVCRPDLDTNVPSDLVRPEELGKFDVRDNRDKFKRRPEPSEFSEFLDDLDFFDAETTIEA